MQALIPEALTPENAEKIIKYMTGITRAEEKVRFNVLVDLVSKGSTSAYASRKRLKEKINDIGITRIMKIIKGGGGPEGFTSLVECGLVAHFRTEYPEKKTPIFGPTPLGFALSLASTEIKNNWKSVAKNMNEELCQKKVRPEVEVMWLTKNIYYATFLDQPMILPLSPWKEREELSGLDTKEPTVAGLSKAWWIHTATEEFIRILAQIKKDEKLLKELKKYLRKRL
ncbi:unnamed protein product [marine sediment metagenome]|uniref:Uncharacterized protein n=1 Tax=marine sediment metagenome TaxID=412755 RepID=X0ZVC9_9ZZZZ